MVGRVSAQNGNELLETGGVLVGDEIEIRIDAEGMLEE